MISIIRFIVIFLVNLPFAIPMVLVNKDTHSYWTCVFIRNMLTPFLCMFYLFGLSRQLAVKLGLANTQVKATTHYELMKYMNDGDEHFATGRTVDYNKIEEIEAKNMSGQVGKSKKVR